MGFTSVLAQAHKLIEASIRPGDTAIDATVGTGVDTAFLAEKVGRNGRVFGFDIQQEALELTKAKLTKQELADRVSLLQRNHAEMDQCLPASIKGQIAAVTFNLGFLPGSDQRVITQAASTLDALSASLAWIKPGGVVTIAAYPGHPGGKEEAESVRNWAETLPAAFYQVLCYEFINQTNRPPFLIAISKKNMKSNRHS